MEKTLFIKQKRNISFISTIGFLMSLFFSNGYAMAMIEDEERGRSPIRSERHQHTSCGPSQENENILKKRSPREQYVEIDIFQNSYQVDVDPLTDMIKELTLDNLKLRKKLDDSNKCCSCFYMLNSAFLKFFGYK